jgi:hypothetical protein
METGIGLAVDVPEYEMDWWGDSALASAVKAHFNSNPHPKNLFGQKHPFRSPEGRGGIGWYTKCDGKQELMEMNLAPDVYNAYLIQRGGVIAQEEKEAAFNAYMKTYGIDNFPRWNAPAWPGAPFVILKKVMFKRPGLCFAIGDSI